MLITGGTSGIGRACVHAFADAEWHVVFTGRDTEAGRALASDVPASEFVVADGLDAGAVHAAATRAIEIGSGQLQGLVLNAGRSMRRTIDDLTLEDWAAVMDTNATSGFLFVRAGIEALRAGRGSVVAISSVAGKGGEAGLAAYAASKAALIGFMQSLAIEEGPRVRFNVVCPGQITTRMMDAVVSDPERLRQTIARIPVGRLGSPEDVAAAVTYLVSPASAFVNGAVITVDGGETAGIPLIRPEGRP